MSPGGKANDPDLLYAPFGRSVSKQAQCSLRILEGTTGRFLRGFARATRHAISQDYPGDANGIEPFSDFFTLEFPVQIPITAAGKDEHGCAGVLFFGRLVNADGWFC